MASGEARVVLTVVAVLTTACAPPPPQSFTPQHNVELRPQTTLFRIPTRPSEIALSADERARLDRFLVGFLERRSGPLTILAATGGSDHDFAQRIAGHVADRGVPASWINIDHNNGASRSAILLRYHAFTVDVAGCGDWRAASDRYFYNTPHPNQGCALARNIALMAADPADLVRGRSAGASDSQRFNLVLQQYRAGELPGAMESEGSEESGAASE